MRKLLKSLVVTVLACAMIVTAVPKNVSAAGKFELSYLSADGKSVAFTLPDDNDYKEVQILNYKNKVVTSDTHISYASFDSAVKKKSAYYARYRYVDNEGNPTSDWSDKIGFVTFKDFEAKQVSKKMEAYYKMPKIKGVKKYIVSASLKKDKGYKKVGTVKPGKKIVIKKIKGKALKNYKNYYVRIEPVLKGKGQVTYYQSGFYFTKSFF